MGIHGIFGQGGVMKLRERIARRLLGTAYTVVGPGDDALVLRRSHKMVAGFLLPAGGLGLGGREGVLSVVHRVTLDGLKDNKAGITIYGSIAHGVEPTGVDWDRTAEADDGER